MRHFTRDYAHVHRVEHYALVAVVCLSVRLSVCLSLRLCPVLDTKSRTEVHRKLKIGRKEPHEIGDP